MTHINRIAAQDLNRISALSDGIFAFAATVLVLDSHLPGIARIALDYDHDVPAGTGSTGYCDTRTWATAHQPDPATNSHGQP